MKYSGDNASLELDDDELKYTENDRVPDSQREIKRIAILTTSVLYQACSKGSQSHSQRTQTSLDHPDRIKACCGLIRSICNTSGCGSAIAAMVPTLKRLVLPGQSRWDLLGDSLLNPPLTPGRRVHPKDPSVANHVGV